MYLTESLLLGLFGLLVLCQRAVGLAINHDPVKRETEAHGHAEHITHYDHRVLKRDDFEKDPVFTHFHDILLDTTSASAEAGAAVVLSVFGDLCENRQNTELCGTTLPDLIAASSNTTAEHSLLEGWTCNGDQDCLQTSLGTAAYRSALAAMLLVTDEIVLVIQSTLDDDDSDNLAVIHSVFQELAGYVRQSDGTGLAMRSPQVGNPPQVDPNGPLAQYAHLIPKLTETDEGEPVAKRRNAFQRFFSALNGGMKKYWRKIWPGKDFTPKFSEAKAAKMVQAMDNSVMGRVPKAGNSEASVRIGQQLLDPVGFEQWFKKAAAKTAAQMKESEQRAMHKYNYRNPTSHLDEETKQKYEEEKKEKKAKEEEERKAKDREDIENREKERKQQQEQEMRDRLAAEDHDHERDGRDPYARVGDVDDGETDKSTWQKMKDWMNPFKKGLKGSGRIGKFGRFGRIGFI